MYIIQCFQDKRTSNVSLACIVCGNVVFIRIGIIYSARFVGRKLLCAIGVKAVHWNERRGKLDSFVGGVRASFAPRWPITPASLGYEFSELLSS